MSEPKSFPYKAGQPWLGVDRREEFEEFIAGNRAGLEALRDAVDRALREGKADIDLPFTEYPGVVVVESDPRETATGKPGFTDLLGCAFAVGLVLAVVMGGAAVFGLVFRWFAH
jgi:hypothetical protein